MNDETPINGAAEPEVEAAEAAAAEVDEVDAAEDAGTEEGPSVVGELRGFGVRLAGALRAAAATPEAQALKTDLRRGMGELRTELDDALDRDKVNELRDKTPPVSGETVRVELAAALHSLNGALDRLAKSVEPAATTGEVDSTATPVEEPSGDDADQ